MMRLNTDAVKAIQDLRGNPAWEVLREALSASAGDLIHRSIMTTAADRIEHTAYARAMSDLCVQFEMAATGAKSTNGIKAPNPMKAAAHAG